MTNATDRQDTDDKHFGRPVEKPRKKTGRPTTFNQEIADRICDHIANGGYATKLERFGLPSSSTLGQWLNANPSFAAEYARARERRAEHFADEMVEIADTAEDAAKARLQVEARKWIASKLLPRVYGENQRVEVQHTLSETAARVLADLSARQKREKAERAKYIDVTPAPVRAEDTNQARIGSNYNALGEDDVVSPPIVQDVTPEPEAVVEAPPAPMSLSGAAAAAPSLVLSTPSEKNTVTRSANAERQRRYRERRAALKKTGEAV